MKKAIVVFSGGPDSTAAAIWAMKNGFNVELLTFQYRHAEQYGELYAAMSVARALKLKHTILDYRSPMHVFPDPIHIMMHAGIREGQVGDTEPHRLPFGAGMILSVAATYAAYNRVYDLVWGATKDDGHGRKDYTKDFADSIAKTVTMCVPEEFRIHTPFSEQHKYEVLSGFHSDQQLFAQTWSCSGDSDQQCGQCHACKARRIAATLARVIDITTYTEASFQPPLTASQIQDPSKIDDAELAGMSNCEDDDW